MSNWMMAIAGISAWLIGTKVPDFYTTWTVLARTRRLSLESNVLARAAFERLGLTGGMLLFIALHLAIVGANAWWLAVQPMGTRWPIGVSDAALALFIGVVNLQVARSNLNLGQGAHAWPLRVVVRLAGPIYRRRG